MLWKPRNVENEPRTVMYNWIIFREPNGHHVAGDVFGEGRVSSAIQIFDPEKKMVITRSGRLYDISSDSNNISNDAWYVLDGWLRLNSLTRDDIEFVTDRYVEEMKNESL